MHNSGLAKKMFKKMLPLKIRILKRMFFNNLMNLEFVQEIEKHQAIENEKKKQLYDKL